MRIVRDPAAMQAFARQQRLRGRRIGLVPTMGALHAGHLSLIRNARRRAGRQGLVVVSIYVNPAQFGPNEDFSRYPRALRQDLRLCRENGANVVFAPADRQMYPQGPEASFSTYVVEEKLSSTMEGSSRPGHFRGVTTVVAKLFHLVQPDFAVFGAKDWQQAAIVKRMVADLNFPIRIIVAPTVRESDGLALSSRNQYLKPEERNQATILNRAIRRAREHIRRQARPAARLRAELRHYIATASLARLDYLEFFRPDTLQPVSRVTRGTHMALAVFFGGTRLIDNGRL